MATVGKFRQEDLSIYFFVRDLVVPYGITKIVDSYPYTELEDGTLTIPCVSVEHSQTVDDGGELGASWFKRTWTIDVFAESDTKRDELSDIIYKALDNTIPIRDFSNGFKSDGKSLAGTDLRIIEQALVENRRMSPTYSFLSSIRDKYWRMSITFDTRTTQAT